MELAVAMSPCSAREINGDFERGVDGHVLGKGALELERSASEQECDLMIEALRRELDGIKNQLAWLTYHLDDEAAADEIDGTLTDVKLTRERDDQESSQEATALQQTRKQSSRLSHTRSGADTPHTLAAKKKAEKTKEEIEKAARAALIEKERKKHYMRVVDRAEEDRKTFNYEYLRLMKVHVEQQRQRVQDNAERLSRKLKNREKKEKALRLQRKPNHFRSQPSSNDTSFLNTLYQSTFYQIIGIENEMKRAGKLKRLTDLKEFWELMLTPPSPPSPTSNAPSHQMMTRQTIATPTRYRPHPFDDDEEEDDGGTSWALTALPPEQNKAKSDPIPRSSSRQPPNLPQVSPIFNILNHGSLIQHSTEKEKERAHRHRIQTLQDDKQHTQHMYQQARANERVMRKLLPDISQLGLDQSVVKSDLRSSLSSIPQQTSLQTSSQNNIPVKTTERRRKEPSIKSKQKKPNQPKESNFLKDSPQPTSSSIVSVKQFPKLPEQNEDYKKAAPLTMNSLLDKATVKEPKGKSMLWSNYK